MPIFDDRFARQNRCEPPPEFPLASPYTGIVHLLSGPAPYALTQIHPRTSGSVDDAPKLSPAFTFITRRGLTPEHSHTKTTPWSVFQDGSLVTITPASLQMRGPQSTAGAPGRTPDDPPRPRALQRLGGQPDGALTLCGVPFQGTRAAPRQKHPLQITTRTPGPDFKFELLPLHSPLLGQSLSTFQMFGVFYGRGRAALPVRVCKLLRRGGRGETATAFRGRQREVPIPNAGPPGGFEG
ncbi:hypothetical protein Trco_006555 [Trichoderma cornu-damae]|uniref:Uncharacterized protein n=1 Tax=Trichoderma cornu-damae TaxID=654480 RepID=A0A9P8QKS8_9HYPO|nr:hypothetical protein Trco_006555 [Trichoderma cornu-damae]